VSYLRGGLNGGLFLLFLMASVTDLLYRFRNEVFFIPAQPNRVNYLGIIAVQKEVENMPFHPIYHFNTCMASTLDPQTRIPI
jgi:hypothetical protein